jgi:hypothetical protein
MSAVTSIVQQWNNHYSSSPAHPPNALEAGTIKHLSLSLLWEAASSGFVEERSLILSGTISDLGLQATEARSPELSSLRTFLSSLAELRSAHRNPMA